MQSLSLAGSVWPWWGQFDKMYFKTLARCILQFWKIHFVFFSSQVSSPYQFPLSWICLGMVGADGGKLEALYNKPTTDLHPQFSYQVSQNIYTNKHLYNLQHSTTNKQQICNPHLSYHLSQNINTHLNYFATPYNLMKNLIICTPFVGK